MHGDPKPRAAPSRRALGLELLVIAIVALAVRLVDLGFPPFIDELNHFLAAGSLLQDGTLAIGDGLPYDRGRLFTYLVAGFMGVFGEGLVIARLPAVISGVFLVCVLFAWLRRESGLAAAWTGGLLLALAPIAIYLSQWVRFYTLHALLFWVGSWGVYRLVTRADPVGRRWWIAVGTLVAFLVAFHLQITTLVGLGGVGLFVVIVEGSRLLAAVSDPRRRWLAIAAACGGVLVVLVGFQAAGLIDWLLMRAAMVDAWALEHATDTRFYHYLFVEQYGFLWVLFPVATLVALASRWRLGLLFAAVFGVAIVSHSLLAWKAERYLFYAMPALFGIWGLAAQEFVPWLWRHLLDGTRTIRSWIPERVVQATVTLALLSAAAFATTGLDAYTTTRQIFVQGKEWSPPPYYRGEHLRGHSDWEAARPLLEPISDSVQVVIGEPDLKMLHYLGELDFILYAGHLAGVTDGGRPTLSPEFSVFRKVGRPTISSPASIDLLISCYESGLIVAERHVWKWRWGVPEETAAFIREHTEPVELPDRTKLVAYRWGGREAESSSTELSQRCVDIRRVRAEAPVGPALRDAE